MEHIGLGTYERDSLSLLLLFWIKHFQGFWEEEENIVPPSSKVISVFRFGCAICFSLGSGFFPSLFHKPPEMTEVHYTRVLCSSE